MSSLCQLIKDQTQVTHSLLQGCSISWRREPLLVLNRQAGPKLRRETSSQRQDCQSNQPKLPAPGPSPGASLFPEHPVLRALLVHWALPVHCQLESLRQWLKGEIIGTPVPYAESQICLTLPFSASTVFPQPCLSTHYQAAGMT